MRPLEPSGRDPIFGKAVQDALEAIPEGLDALALVTRLSRALVPELARRAASLHVLRLRSRDKFPRLAPPFLTALGLEQASSEIVAVWRAARVAASAPGSRVLDATCGIGGDLLAHAAAGVEVVGADRDAECAAFARANLESHRLPPRVVVADASRPAVIADHLLLDPDRRAAYFGQAAYGVPVRMALLALLLGVEQSDGLEPPAHPEQVVEDHPRCPNPDCANHCEGYTTPKMLVTADGRRQCLYCDMELTV